MPSNFCEKEKRKKKNILKLEENKMASFGFPVICFLGAFSILGALGILCSWHLSFSAPLQLFLHL
jgi:hypothetical protein